MFAATLQGRIICFCGQSGEEKWIYTVGKPIFSSPSVDESGIYFGCVDGRVYSLRPNGDLVSGRNSCCYFDFCLITINVVVLYDFLPTELDVSDGEPNFFFTEYIALSKLCLYWKP